MEFEDLDDDWENDTPATTVVCKKPAAQKSAKRSRIMSGHGVHTQVKKPSLSWPEPDRSLTDRPLRLGTHFSGWESVAQSLKMLRINFVHEFACDLSRSCRRFIANNFSVKCLYDNVLDKPLEDLAYDLDLYASGSPCPSFSRANMNAKGVDDPRGRLIYVQCDYISKMRPKSFFLEQVSTLKTRNANVFKDIMESLKEAGYVVSWKLVNTREHNLPHNRPRIYIVGLRRDVYDDGRPFKWPKRMPKSNNLLDVLERNY